MPLEFDCIECGQHFELRDSEGGIVFLVWKDGARFYACSQKCASKARDNDGLNPSNGSAKKFPFAGMGARPAKDSVLDLGRVDIPNFENLRNS